jgi:hypothetical protein
MDTRTGAIARFETREDALRAGHELQLTDEKAEQLLPLDRAARLSVAKQMTIDDRRARKVKRQAQRAARKANR